VLQHADPSVCSLPVDTLSRSCPHRFLQVLAAPSTISVRPFAVTGALPALHSVPNCHSNPIAQRLRRKRQRLPPSLLIENASGVSSRLPENSLPEAFPIKASDHSGVVSCRPQSKCPVRPPVRWEMPISSFFGCIKSSLSRLPCTGCLATVLHQKHGEVRGERFGGKLPHH